MKIIFKHSSSCPVSMRAKHEMDRFLKNNPLEIEYEIVDVINNRKRSDEIVEIYSIRHESPQVIILDENGHVKWHASHYTITEEHIKQALS
ncbi:MAG TPA: bacillithiol system redox-active protein YtxJ [Candidatus Deferrimicrobium sp.]|nr:bacillithiol system redox-active protein YtxJ [Candidatus Deferrimicrobium sp.]